MEFHKRRRANAEPVNVIAVIDSEPASPTPPPKVPLGSKQTAEPAARQRQTPRQKIDIDTINRSHAIDTTTKDIDNQDTESRTHDETTTKEVITKTTHRLATPPPPDPVKPINHIDNGATANPISDTNSDYDTESDSDQDISMYLNHTSVYQQNRKQPPPSRWKAKKTNERPNPLSDPADILAKKFKTGAIGGEIDTYMFVLVRPTHKTCYTAHVIKGTEEEHPIFACNPRLETEEKYHQRQQWILEQTHKVYQDVTNNTLYALVLNEMLNAYKKDRRVQPILVELSQRIENITHNETTTKEANTETTPRPATPPPPSQVKLINRHDPGAETTRDTSTQESVNPINDHNSDPDTESDTETHNEKTTKETQQTRRPETPPPPSQVKPINQHDTGAKTTRNTSTQESVNLINNHNSDPDTESDPDKETPPSQVNPINYIITATEDIDTETTNLPPLLSPIKDITTNTTESAKADNSDIYNATTLIDSDLESSNYDSEEEHEQIQPAHPEELYEVYYQQNLEGEPNELLTWYYGYKEGCEYIAWTTGTDAYNDIYLTIPGLIKWDQYQKHKQNAAEMHNPHDDNIVLGHELHALQLLRKAYTELLANPTANIRIPEGEDKTAYDYETRLNLPTNFEYYRSNLPPRHKDFRYVVLFRDTTATKTTHEQIKDKKTKKNIYFTRTQSKTTPPKQLLRITDLNATWEEIDQLQRSLKKIEAIRQQK